jgi:NAD(P)-dependent dehydrogenase (short-subunit alcohol dehydrogenase family)
MTTKTVLITGASSGIGFQTAKLLAESGSHHIILHARDTHKAKQAVAQLQSQLPPHLHTNLQAKSFDLTDLSAISDFCKQAQDVGSPLDILINNAGIMACPKTIITRGKHSWEAQLLVNHLSHYLLTILLLLPSGSNSYNNCKSTNTNTNNIQPSATSSTDAFPNPQYSPLCRVVNVSSAAHLIGSINYTDPCFLIDDNKNDIRGNTKRQYNPWTAYGQSKLAQCMFSKHLYDRYGVDSTSLHPGIAPTMLIRHVLPPWLIKGMHGMDINNSNSSRTLDESGWVKAAARRVVNVATNEGGSYGRGGGGKHFYSPVAKVVDDEKECEKLWNLSAELVDGYL